MDNRQLMLFEFLTCLVAWSAIAIAFVGPRLARVEPRRALRALIAPQMFRIIGLTLLANNVAAPGLDHDFARWVAIGDATTSLLAVATFIALGSTHRIGIVLAWLTTIVGTADLIRNVSMGMRINAPEYLGAGFLVVAVIVPGMLVAHAFAARQLAKIARERR